MKSQPALILVDIQKGFEIEDYFGGNRNNPEAEENAKALLTLWREHKLPIFHVKHNSIFSDSPLRQGQPGNEFHEKVKPLAGEPVIGKSVNSAFIGTDLEDWLDRLKITKLVIAGLTTDHCISTTTRMAGNFGFDTFLVSDATATFNKKGIDGEDYSAELIHATALASLNNEFATIVTTGFLKKNI